MKPTILTQFNNSTLIDLGSYLMDNEQNMISKQIFLLIRIVTQSDKFS